MSGPVYIGLVATSGSNSDGQTIAYDHVTLTGITAPLPPAPTNLTVTFVDSSYAILNWTAPATGDDLAGYNVSVSTAGGPFMDLGNTTDISYTVSGLMPNTDYTFHVKALDLDDDESDAASVIGNSGAGILASVIDSDTSTPAGGGALRSATIQWTNHASGILKTYVEVKENGDSNWFSLVDVGYPDTTTTATLAGLSAGAQYQVRIRTIAAGGNAYSSPYTLDLPGWDADTSIDQGPSVATSGGYTSVTWTNTSESPPDHILLTQTGGAPFPDRWYGTPEIGTSALLLGDGSYAWLAGAKNGVVANQSDPAVAAPFANYQQSSGSDAPTLTGTRDGNGKVQLIWNAEAGLKYEVMQLEGVDQDQWTSGTFNYDADYLDPVTGDPKQIVAFQNGSGGHTMDRPGYFAVASYTTVNGVRVYSPASNLVDLAVAYTPKYGTAAKSGSEARLVWDDTAYNETGYVIQWTDNTNNWPPDNDANSTGDTTVNGARVLNSDISEYRLTGLDPNKSYAFRVKAMRKTGATGTQTLDSQWKDITVTSPATPAGVLPELVVKELAGGHFLSDDNNDPNLPSAPLTTIFDYSTNLAACSITLLNELSSDALPGTYTYMVYPIGSTGGTVVSGSITQGQTITWTTAAKGHYEITLTSSADSSLQRKIDVYVAALSIVWKGQDIKDSAGAVVVHNGDTLNNKTVGYLAGQHLSLGYVLSTGVGTTTPDLIHWQIGKTTDYIKGYTATNAIGAVDPLTGDDLSSTTAGYVLNTYGVVDAPMRRFTLTATATVDGSVLSFQAATTFDIKKPGRSIYNSGYNDFTFKGTDSVPTIDRDVTMVSGHMKWDGNVNGPEEARVSFIQLHKADSYYIDIAGLPHSIYNTHGFFRLDPSPTGPTYSSGSATSSDDPFTNIHSNMQEISRNERFRTWMMWTPPGADSVQVPIAELEWAFSVDVQQLAYWTFVSKTPTVDTTILGKMTDSYPQWIGTTGP
jgi:hypothetical protein